LVRAFHLWTSVVSSGSWLFGCFWPASLHSLFLGSLWGFHLPLLVSLVPFYAMFASMRVEGKFFEVSGSGRGPFPFTFAESSRRKRVFFQFSFQEFQWLPVQMVRFCFSKGEPMWVRSFR